jgi:hypothetical protein
MKTALEKKEEADRNFAAEIESFLRLTSGNLAPPRPRPAISLL